MNFVFHLIYAREGSLSAGLILLRYYRQPPTRTPALPRSVFPPYDAVVLLGANAANDPAIRSALLPLIGSINNDQMRDANMRVDVEGKTVDAAVELLRPGLNERTTVGSDSGG